MNLATVKTMGSQDGIEKIRIDRFGNQITKNLTRDKNKHQITYVDEVTKGKTSIKRTHYIES